MEVNFRKLYFVAICLACLCWSGPDFGLRSKDGAAHVCVCVFAGTLLLSASFLLLLLRVICSLREGMIVKAALEIGLYLVLIGVAIFVWRMVLPIRFVLLMSGGGSE